MTKDTPEDLSALAEQLAVVVQEVVEEAVPRTQQEDTELRDLEEVVQVSMKRVGQHCRELLVEACRPEQEPATIPCRCGGLQCLNVIGKGQYSRPWIRFE